MPTNLDCRIRIKVDGGEARLGSPEGRSYLGYSTFVRNVRGAAHAGV
jgi:hypothetical protein